MIGDQFHQKLLRHLSKEAAMPVTRCAPPPAARPPPRLTPHSAPASPLCVTSGMFDKRVREMVTLGFFVDKASASGAPFG